MKIYFGENLKRLRKEKELTQETLADFLGVSFQAVSKWERNESYPNIVPSTTHFCLDEVRNIFAGAVNIRHYLNNNLLNSGEHIGDGISLRKETRVTVLR